MTPGQLGDVRVALALISAVPPGRRLTCDAAYDSDGLRRLLMVLEGPRGEESIAELCRREGMASSMYYGWSKEFLEAGKRQLTATRRALRPLTR